MFVAAILLASSCTHEQSVSLHRTGEVTLAAGLIGILAVVATAELIPDHKTGILEGGAVCVPISLFGALAYIATDAEVNGPREAALTPEQRSFNAAYEIAREAKHAARKGDCATVQAIQPRVRELNERVYRKFLHEPIIRACLAPETLPPSEPPPVLPANDAPADSAP